jgi:hypothetical protein
MLEMTDQIFKLQQCTDVRSDSYVHSLVLGSAVMEVRLGGGTNLVRRMPEVWCRRLA